MKKVPIKKTINNVDSLSKYLAQAGIASRRKVVDVIKSGVVTVNNTVIKEPGFKISPNDVVCVNGAPVQSEDKIYILLNKPKNCITTVSDERGRHNVLDLIGDKIKTRVYPVGRLDRNTTGLLILTNDGDLALKLSHPRFEIIKVYNVTLDKNLTKKDMQHLLTGVELEDGFVMIDEAYTFKNESQKKVTVVLHSGKYRVVRRLFEALGYEVTKLDRVEYAGLTKKDLEVGKWRYLTNTEVNRLKNNL
jgi:23S rRNA pseudouridine2605 synthase